MRVCIVGGGTAGWMTAAALGKKFQKDDVSIILVESDQIGTVGVGEATLPHIRFFNQALGIDEADFMRQTQATFKLGIEFVDWGKLGQRYIHPFGDFGESINDVDFYQYWLKLQANQGTTSEDTSDALGNYAFGIVAAQQNKFKIPQRDTTNLQNAFGYAYQFDSTLYAKFLREFSQRHGVKRIEGKIVDSQLEQKSGAVQSVKLEDGAVIQADLYIDCSGFRGLLIEQALHSGYQDWSRWLPCNKAIAVPCESDENISPYTRATAREAGWMWKIPLQHRTGNGHVYWDEFISDQDASDALLAQLSGKPTADPRQLFFKTGRRNHFWKKNVVAIGLSAGFLEPLESTSIHLIQEAITALVEFFPQTKDNATAMDENDIREFNAKMGLQYERVRDFLLLHYVANDRSDSKMWRYFREMELPLSLQEKIDAWLRRGYVQRYEFGAFLPPSWVAVMLGQNLIPRHYDPRVNKLNTNEINKISTAMKEHIAQGVKAAKSHQEFLDAYGAASGRISL